ncbi:MAG: hypothetical protein ACN4GR_03085 [Arenicellales bacterium]
MQSIFDVLQDEKLTTAVLPDNCSYYGLFIHPSELCKCRFTEKNDPVAEATPFALTFFPTEDSLDPFEGEPESAAVYDANKLLGYVFFTDHVCPYPATPVSLCILW